MRIISLGPTQTEIIAALKAEANLVGITENCDYPEHIKGLPTYGSWWAPDLPGIIRDAPDLVYTFGKHQEEMAAALREAGLTVYHSDPGTVAASLEAMKDAALILGREEVGETLLEGLTERIGKVESALASRTTPAPRVLRIMNWNPLISVGPGSFQHDVIGMAGGRNIMGDALAPYLVCSPELAAERNPQVIFFCEPHLVEVLHRDPTWQEVEAVRENKIFVFDCGLTCRSGPRIVDMLDGLATVLYPKLFQR